MGGWLRKAELKVKLELSSSAVRVLFQARSLNFDVSKARPGRDSGSMGKAVNTMWGVLPL